MALQHAHQQLCGQVKSSPCCGLGPPHTGHHPAPQALQDSLSTCLFNKASEFLPRCWLHHHTLKPSNCSAKDKQPHYKSSGQCRALCSQLTMSSLPFFCSMLEKATVVRTQAASEQYVLMAARCWASPCSEIAELKLGQYIHRYRVPGGMGTRGRRRERKKNIGIEKNSKEDLSAQGS